MFENYPKVRPPLSKEIQKIYAKHYKSNRNGETTASGLAQTMEQWMHKKVSADVKKSHNKTTLEIGAGTLNQLAYEQPKHYDIVEPFSELFKGSKYLKKIKNIYNDIDDIRNFEIYDRITSVATFEHIIDLPKVIAKSCLLLKKNGTLRTSIPNEGTFLWTLGWKLTTGLEFKLKHRLNYGNLMRHEHVNNADEIEDILSYFYENNFIKVYGINKRIAFYRFYESSNPNLDRAKNYLKNYDKK